MPLFVLAACVSLLAGCQRPAAPSCEGEDCQFDESEPNDTFATVNRVGEWEGDTVIWSGAIDSDGDVDVYDLGAAQAGDAVQITALRLTGNLRSAIALYDQEQELVNEDTLIGLSALAADPSLEHIVREDTNHLYVAIAQEYGSAATGTYELSIVMTRGGTAPAPKRQVIYLNFAGGQAYEPIFGWTRVGAFDSGDIDELYEGETEAIKTTIKQTFHQNYERFDVEILDSDNDEPPADGGYSEVLFGGYNDIAFGVAEDVDLYNQNDSDVAIIFTESFEPGVFRRPPQALELGVAIGNVAAHEMGHILGLHHVRNSLALMDEYSPAVALLGDQEFMSASLSPTIFPLGRQDSADLLRVIVGSNANLPEDATLRALDGKVVAPACPELREDAGTITRGKCLTCMMREARAGKGPLGKLIFGEEVGIATPSPLSVKAPGG